MDGEAGADLVEACAVWQSGRNGGSSRLRGAARVITGIPHYFDAAFIRAYEDAAREDPDALRHGKAILDALAESPLRTASEWAVFTGVEDAGFAGRGLAPNPEKDEAVESRLDSGTIDTPLWGLSLDRTITEQYGGRFLLEIEGPFPAVPAWIVSSVKADERELITGGRYEVNAIERSPGFTRATLHWAEALKPQGL